MTEPCFNCKQPTDWKSPAGYWVCDDCRSDYEHFTGPKIRPVDLDALLRSEPPEQEWLVEPILLARKLTGIVSKRGEGKSLLMLDIAARLAAGKGIFEQPASQPIHVVYIDQEMGPDDLWDRLTDLGWTPDNPDFDTLVEHLHYYQLADLPPLDTKAGGDALEELVDVHKVSLVVIDTVSRVISGDENATEPFRDMFRYTESRLKRRGIALARLDHLGKDPSRGSRGASAKEDPLDVVWQLEETAISSLSLVCTKGRQGNLPDKLTVTREYDNGVLRHMLPTSFASQWLLDLVEEIDGYEIPQDAGIDTVQRALREKGQGRRRAYIAQAVRFRKRRLQGVPKNREHPGNTPSEHLREHPGTPTQETFDYQGKHNGNTGGNTPEQSKGVFPPPKGGTPQTTSFDETTSDDLPDPF